MCKNRQAMIIELSCIRQLVFELHFFGPMTDPDEIRSLFSMLKGINFNKYQDSADGHIWHNPCSGPQSTNSLVVNQFFKIFRSWKCWFKALPISTIKDKNKIGIRWWFFDTAKWKKHIHVRFVMAQSQSNHLPLKFLGKFLWNSNGPCNILFTCCQKPININYIRRYWIAFSILS